MDFFFMIPGGAICTVRKYFAQAVHRLTFPSAPLVRVYLVLGCDLLDSLIAAQCLKRDAGLELR